MRDDPSRVRAPGRSDGVDLLRGIAIGLVLMNHVNMRLVLASIPYTRGLPVHLVDFLVWNGQYGVQIFFRRLNRGFAAWPRWLGAGGLALLLCILGFHTEVDALGLVRSGLDMTLCALGTSMVIAAAVRTNWHAPRTLAPLATIGRHSYEIYLTHMFIVFMLFDLFLTAGSPSHWLPALFIVVLLVSGALGGVVARLYSEPMNRFLRQRWPGVPPDPCAPLTIG